MVTHRFISCLLLSFVILLLMEITLIVMTGAYGEGFAYLIYFGPYYNTIPLAAFLILLPAALGISFLTPLRLSRKIHFFFLILLQIATTLLLHAAWEFYYDGVLLAVLAAGYLVSMVISSFIVNIYALRPLIFRRGKLWRGARFEVHSVYFLHSGNKIVVAGTPRAGIVCSGMQVNDLSAGKFLIESTGPIRNAKIPGLTGLVLSPVTDDLRPHILNIPAGTLLNLWE